MTQGVDSALGLCRSAGKLVMGFDAVCEGAAKGTVSLVLAASDVSSGTLKRLKYACDGLAEVVVMPFTQEQLRIVSMRKVAVYGVADPNLANLCLQKLAAQTIATKEETSNG